MLNCYEFVKIRWNTAAVLGALTLCYDLSVWLFAVLDKVVNDFPGHCQLSLYDNGYWKVKTNNTL